MFDLILSLLFCIFILPIIIIIIGTIIKLDSKGPIFFKQLRTGKNRNYFVLYKFRTMYHPDQEVNNNFIQAKKDDLRITKFGEFLRRTNIDELPQFINVLKGDMSIVGPRPHEINEDKFFENLVNNYNNRYLVKPGITGWAQVNDMKGEINDINAMQLRVEYDIWYITNWSFLLDVKIIITTAMKIIQEIIRIRRVYKEIRYT
ncbi:sugar transferase [Rosettibacter primus]|uniref:sugar transferase n=1 Tax=Rosettibacter primus TaxID=3111523 RepID=UPI00336BF199